MVQFAADIDDSGTGKDKLGELTIVSPTPDHVPGVFKGEGAPRPIRRPPKRPVREKNKAAFAAGQSWFDNSSQGESRRQGGLLQGEPADRSGWQAEGRGST